MSKFICLFAAPFLSSILMFISPTFSGKNFKRIAVALSLLPLLILLSFGYTNWIGEKLRYPWLSPLNIEFHLIIDNLSLLFLYLTTIIIPITLIALKDDFLHLKTFYGLVLLLEGLLIGFFTAHDLALFTIFWEAMLLPLYFIITLFGGPNRQTAALKFLIYMIAGSALMVAAVFSLFFAAGETFNFDQLTKVASQLPHASWVYAAFILAFSVKTPLFPFHAWLPDAYCQAPTAGTVLLSSLLSKAGIYGFLRIGLGFFPDLMKEWGPLFLGWAIAGVIYGGFAAWMQHDFKRLLAYSSFSHVNFVLTGIFIWDQLGHQGAVLQALNHGVTIAGLFIVAGWLEERLGTTSINSYSGIAKYCPQLCWLTMIFVLSSVALPGTNNFIGEFLILFAIFIKYPWFAALLGFTVILSVIYMLRWMQKVYFEEPTPYQNYWTDIRGKELLIALPLVALIFWFGIYPAPVLQKITETSTDIASVEAS